MRMGSLAAAVGGAAAALAAGVIYIAPQASANSDFCESLGNPAHIHECNCGADFHPGTPEYQECLHGAAAVPGPAKPATP